MPVDVDPITAFVDFVRSLPGFREAELGTVRDDGEVHRFPLDRRDTKRSGWYVLRHLAVGHWGVIGSWRSGERHEFRSWQSAEPHALAAVSAEMDRVRRRLDREQRARASAAADRARRLVLRSEPTTDHPGHAWAARKQLATPLRNGPGGTLIVPLTDASGTIVSAQIIRSDGTRRFLAGSQVRGARFVIGRLDEAAACIIVCEGVSTGDALHRATNCPVVCAMSAANLEAVAASIRKAHPSTAITIAADNDARIGEDGTVSNPGLAAARAAARTANCLVACPPEPGTDFHDVLTKYGPEAVRGIIEAAEPPPPDGIEQSTSRRSERAASPQAETDPTNGAVRFRLDCSRKPLRDVDNVARLIRDALADRLQFDTFTQTFSLDGSADHVADRILAELFTAAPNVSWTPDLAAQGLEYAAATGSVRLVDSLRAALDAITAQPGATDWFDAAVRNGLTLAHDYDPATGAAVLRTWMIGAVARILDPGHKVDVALVLQGPQGVGKSSLLKALALDPSMFCDDVTMHRLDEKDVLMQLAGIQVVEMQELAGLRRAELASIKKWLTQTVDRYRPPYGRSVITLPRRFVVGASTNETEYLRDTENRRWMVLRVAGIDVDWFARHRNHLYAQARDLFTSGIEPVLPARVVDTMRDEHDRAAERDPWEDAVLAALASMRPRRSSRGSP
jgi:putative DNA primase/helicase